MVANFNPGPGYYGQTRDPKFTDVYKTSFADIFRIPKEHRGLFKSKVKGLRFRSVQTSKKKSKNARNPGPGAYFKEKPLDRYLKEKRDEKLEELKRVRLAQKNSIKQITTPTIPNHLNHFGYIKDENNFYILELEKNEMSALGPGSYNPKFSMTKKKTLGGNFGKEKRKFAYLHNDHNKEHLGPGAYSNTENIKEKKMKHIQKVIEKKKEIIEQKRQKLRKRQEKLKEAVDRKRDLEEFERMVLEDELKKKVERGEIIARGIKKKQKPFNSTSVRTQKISESMKRKNLGPGTYLPINKMIMEEVFRLKKNKEMKKKLNLWKPPDVKKRGRMSHGPAEDKDYQYYDLPGALMRHLRRRGGGILLTIMLQSLVLLGVRGKGFKIANNLMVCFYQR